ncbi:hypothetical protein Tco_0285982 [Tanacetum coccineum]
MADSKLARRVSMSSPTDSIYYGGGGNAVCGGAGDTDDDSDGEGDLDILRDEDGKSDGGGEDDDGVKSDGGDDNDGKVVISSSESDMMTNGANTPARGVVAGKGVRRGVVVVL